MVFLDEMNRFISTVIAAPMTMKGRHDPTGVRCVLQGKQSQFVLDRIRTVGKKRLVERLGVLSKKAQSRVMDILQEMLTDSTGVWVTKILDRCHKGFTKGAENR